jgi:hypothetical protein
MAKTTSGRESKGVNLDPAFVNQVARGAAFTNLSDAAAYTVKSITSGTWMSPMQPLSPIADGAGQGTAGRQFDYRVGQNKNITPRSEENISFGQLRAMADGYDIMRLVIETRKDQLEAMDWEIVPIDTNRSQIGVQETGKDADIKAVTAFFQKPSLEHDWSTWLRMLLEDLLVLDAVAVYPRQNRGNKVASFDLVDAGTIKRVIDETGRTPIAPDPAYQQVLHGVPAIDYTTEELLYFVRNPRTNRIYGYSPVEQVIMTVNIALRRQIHQLQYYTEGNIPDAIVGVAETWTADQIKDFQQWFDDTLSGNTAKRRKMTFIPGDASKMQYTREPTLKDDMDEWLVRVVCFAFSIAPTPFIRQLNRSTAQSGAESAKEEGLQPLMIWVKRRIDFLITNVMGYSGIEFNWKVSASLDPAVQAGIDVTDVKAGIKTIDEVRTKRGDPPLPNNEGSRPLIYTATGVVKLTDALAAPPPPTAQEQQAAQDKSHQQNMELATAKSPAAPVIQSTPAAKFEKSDIPPQVFNITTPPVTVNAGGITVTPPPINIHMPDTLSPVIKVDVAAAQVHVPAPQVINNFTQEPTVVNVTTPDVRVDNVVKYHPPEFSPHFDVTLPSPDVTVHLPARQTVTKTMRDNDGNLTGSTSVEKDVD